MTIYIYDYSFIHTGAYRISGLSGLVCGNIFEHIGKSWKNGGVDHQQLGFLLEKRTWRARSSPTSVATNQVMKLPTTKE